MKNPAGSFVARGVDQPMPRSTRVERRLAKKHHKKSIPTRFRRITKSTKGVITYVLDTNVIMTAWDSLFKFEEHNVCIVGQVWEELDKYKKGRSSEAYNVRRAIKAIDALLRATPKEQISKGVLLTPPPELLNGKPHTGKLFIDYSEPTVPEGMDTCLNVNHPDDRIILICLAKQKAGERVVLVSNDASCRVKATIAGLDAEEYLNDTVDIVKGEEDLRPGFHHMSEGFLESALVDCESKSDCTSYTLKHAALKAVTCNEFLVMPDCEPLRVISSDGAGNAVAETFRFRKEIKEMGIVPKNIEQEFALQLLFDTRVTGVSLAGLAGSGKTFLTLGFGIYAMQFLNLYDRVIFTRSMQDADEPIGFLPGDSNEKVSPWMGALWDNIDSLLKSNNNAEKRADALAKLRESIKVEPLTFMKGRSFMNTLIIVDETQDLSPKALKMICTRLAEGSKIVFLGNVAQIDNPHLTEYTCGLSVFIRKFLREELAGHVTLQRGVRSPFATLAEELL